MSTTAQEKKEGQLNFYQKLRRVQETLGAATRDSNNPHFRYNYSSYNETVEVAKEALNPIGLAFEHGYAIIEGEYGITTTIFDDEGNNTSIWVPARCKDKNDPQQLGSGITYAKRYGLQTKLGMRTEDDDGNKAAISTDIKTPTKKDNDIYYDEYDDLGSVHTVEKGICPECGGELVNKRGTNKNGKPYNMMRCSSCSHVTWLKP